MTAVLYAALAAAHLAVALSRVQGVRMSWFAELLDWRMAFVFWVVTIAIGTVTYFIHRHASAADNAVHGAKLFVLQLRLSSRHVASKGGCDGGDPEIHSNGNGLR